MKGLLIIQKGPDEKTVATQEENDTQSKTEEANQDFFRDAKPGIDGDHELKQ